MSFEGLSYIYPFNVEAITFDTTTRASSGRPYTVERDAHYWSITVGLGPPDVYSKRNAAGILMAHRSVHRSRKAFDIEMPQFPGLAIPNAQPVLDVAALEGNTQITLAHFAGTILRGTFIRIGDDPKVYQVGSDRAGAGDMLIEPALRKNAPKGARLDLTPDITVIHAPDVLNAMGWDNAVMRPILQVESTR